ncbi:GAF domain-containing sensor histidine kinase [Pseudalkalibacillus berkeleyi]|uniref:histidine kinase n=1 Tax=Pseudalkalibacillus berkeleyi TaxID=1069813 RepID=A0ABS9GUC8_9BACL|nr:GAF domain-containing sensor histidine kinase [Pseudalkalibacillus berkeleyi]MCF6136444.1 GAF domain-containing sensor histidine kinase [Pseudalkalibacillus berkeleyi]
MGQDIQLFKKERYANLYLLLISIIGWVSIGISSLYLDTPENSIVLLLFVLFLFITEFFPMAVWKGHSSLSFPLVFTIYLVYGLSWVVVTYGFVVFAVNYFQRRPLRILFFNPALLVLSFIIGETVSRWLIGDNYLSGTLIAMVLITVLFYIFNNILVDIVLILRPQSYTKKIWVKKFKSELISFLIAIIYIGIMFYLGKQNRGVIDVFSYFFFFSPLVGLALLSSIIARLQTERNRLNALFDISTDLNRGLPSNEWVDSIRSSLNQFVDADASILWVKENGQWKVHFHNGQVNEHACNSVDELRQLDEINELTIVHDRKKHPHYSASYFNKGLKSIIFAPIMLEDHLLGMFTIAKSRSNSFSTEEIQSIATLANQLAVVIKTRTLISEQEKRTVLEERNRIAREIHDGVAQSLAGAVMKLETADRKFHQKPPEAHRLVTDSLGKLRLSLKEIRESIYALRPYETERVGLKQAVLKRIDVIKKETGLNIHFEERGKSVYLSPMVEKVMYDIFQESVQNIIKHAQATKIEVLLSYQKEHVLLKVADNGIGFSLLDAMIKAKNDPHFGILSMNEQAEKIEAVLQIDSKEGKGSEINLHVPKLGMEGGMSDDQRHASG